MSQPDSPAIPEQTIEALARSFFGEASQYGFQHVDVLRFVNLLLDISLNHHEADDSRAQASALEPSDEGGARPALPLMTDQLQICAYDHAAHFEAFETWMADRAGQYFLLSRSTAEHVALDEVLKSPHSHIGVICLPEGRPIGCVAYLHLDRRQHKAELRKIIGDSTMRGRGYAKLASRLWLDYGLRTLGLRKIYLNTLFANVRNIKLNEDIGFTVEGILRNEVLIDGRYRDVLRMAFYREQSRTFALSRDDRPSAP